MKVLVVGASGATGQHVVAQLLHSGYHVKTIVRPSSSALDAFENDKKLELFRMQIANTTPTQMAKILEDCNTVISCLGHNLTLKGIWGKPRKLVTDAVRVICQAIDLNEPDSPVKFILMNTTGNLNRGLKEKISFFEKMVLGSLRILLPPQSDNENAAEYLRLITNKKHIEWVAVRPDTLINEDEITPYDVYSSPLRSPVFNPGKTSRINVANFMVSLTNDPELWDKWSGSMPVIYNQQT